MKIYIVQKRPYRLKPPWGRWYDARTCQTKDEAKALMICWSRAFPKNQFRVRERKQ